MSASQYTHDSPTHKIKSGYKFYRTCNVGKKITAEIRWTICESLIGVLEFWEMWIERNASRSGKNRDGERGLNFSLPEYY